jgi:O-methyltransferase
MESTESPPRSGDKRVKVRDRDFRRVAKRIAADGRTLLGADRLWVLWQCIANTAPLGHPIAEVGSYRGGSARFLAEAMLHFGSRASVHVVDTFAGHPAESLSELDPEVHAPGLFGDTSAEAVRRYLRDLRAVQVHEGAFQAVRGRLPDGPYAFAHLDVDLYEPMLDGLRFFGSRLPVGGAMVLDDYDARKCPGVREAAEQWLAEVPGQFHTLNPLTEQLVVARVRT